MKKKIVGGIAGLLLASSTIFAAGWGDHHERYERRVGYERRGGVYLGVSPGYYGYGYTAPAPYVNSYATPYGDPYAAPAPYVAPGPYVNEYVAPAPYYGGGVWVGGRWRNYHGRDRGYWGRR